MGFYAKHILPKLLDSAMADKELYSLRPLVVSDATGAVLEIGFGSGHNLSFYTHISKLYALEPSKEAVEIAKSRTTGISFPVEFLIASAEAIPLPNASVDTVISTWTLCSVSHPEKVLSEIHRVLRAGGQLRFIDHGASARPLTRAIQSTLTPFTKHFTGNCHLDRDIEALIRSVGFSVEILEKKSKKYQPLMFNVRGIATKH